MLYKTTPMIESTKELGIHHIPSWDMKTSKATIVSISEVPRIIIEFREISDNSIENSIDWSKINPVINPNEIKLFYENPDDWDVGCKDD